MGRGTRRIAAAILLVCGLGGSAAAQQAVTSATIGGRVLDPTGAAIAGASVGIVDVERNQRRDTTTDAKGRYQFLYLPVGAYRLVVSSPGFADRDVALTLSVGAALELPITMQVASVAADVQVSAAAPVVEAARTQFASSVTPHEIDTLPLNGRNYLDLALLVPTVSRTAQTNTQLFAETSAVPGTGISIAGQRNLNNGFIVDGLSANDDAADLAGTYFAQDVIREFQVVTSGGVAEFGRASAGVVNIVTQSGTNQWHGDAYEFYRGDRFDAKNAFAAAKTPLTRSQYGASGGGAIVPDRTFWFANVEQTRLNQTNFVTIPQASVAAINASLAAAGYGGPRLATGGFRTGYDTTNLFGRLDQQVGEQGRLSARYSLYDVSSPNARNVGGLNAVSRGTALSDRDSTFAVNLLNPLSSSAINELRGQYTTSRLDAPVNDAIGPAVTISGVASFGTATSSPTSRDLTLVEVNDSLTLQRGEHLVKIGGDLTYERVNIVFPGALQGVYAFANLGAFERGQYINYQQAFGQAAQAQTNPNLGVFVQDEWRPRADVTVNAGLRYDLQWLDRLVRTDTNNVAPRFGVSYAPGSGRTVVRGTAGLYFDRVPLRALSNALQRGDPLNYRTALLSFGQAGAPVFPSVMPAFPDGVLTNITTIDPALQSPRSVQAGVQVERELGAGTSASIGYVHLAGRGIMMSINQNVPTLTAAQAAALGIANLGRPDSRVANNTQYQSIGISRYDGLTMSLRADRTRWGSLRVSYTLGRALDDTGNNFFNQPQDAKNVLGDWGRSDNDQRHHLTVSGSTPAIAAERGAARLLRGFQLSAVFSYASAPPFNVQTGADRNGDTNVNDRPAGVARNTGVGFDTATLDLRLSRSLAIVGSHRLELSVDVFNVLNRTNFLTPNNIFGTGVAPLPAFGRPTQAADPRELQFGVRWSF